MPQDRRTYLQRHEDPLPHLPVERGLSGRGVGWWVPEVKHRLLADYVEATWGARRKFPDRVLIDLFSGPGRIQVEGEDFTRDGGSLVAWRQSLRKPETAFTQVLVGDLDPARAAACEARLQAAGAPARAFPGPALETAARAVAALRNRRGLCLAYLDPYNLEHLAFDVIRTLAALPKIDFAVHFSTMDLTRNVELEFKPSGSRFDAAVPGWRSAIDPAKHGKKALREEVFEYWVSLVQQLGFTCSQRMPLIKDENNRPRYRLVFFSRAALPNDIWSDVAQGATRDLFG